MGARLVEECIRFARRAGYAAIILWTYDALDAARRIYERAGFARLKSKRPHHSFSRDLVEEIWARGALAVARTRWANVRSIQPSEPTQPRQFAVLSRAGAPRRSCARPLPPRRRGGPQGAAQRRTALALGRDPGDRLHRALVVLRR